MDIRIFLLSTILALLGILGYRELRLQPNGQLRVYFLDIGQGDATLLVTPSGKQILIDSGPDASILEHLGRLMPYFDRTIELLILTHPHSDHLAVLPEILRRYEVQHILLGGSDYASKRYEAVIHELLDQRIPTILASPSRDIDMGDGTLLDIIWPQSDLLTNLNPNNTSVVVRILFGKEAILLSGDIEQETEAAILRSGADLHANILKVPHHGSMSSSSTGFLLAVRPELGIVSVGRGNRFGHPHREVLKRYEKMGIPLRSTAKEGTISLTFTP